MHHSFNAIADPILLRGSPSSSVADAGNGRDPDVLPAPTAEPQLGYAATGRFIRSLIKARASRREIFGAHLFADPAWDMLLELFALTCEGRRVSVSKLSHAAGVPGTTALRWIDKLETECLILRSDDPHDARRVWVTLSRSGFSAMNSFVERVTGREAVL